LHGDRVFDFDVVGSGEVAGRCFITAADAATLPRLSPEWVRRALPNLVGAYGAPSVVDRLSAGSGVQLRADDGYPVR